MEGTHDVYVFVYPARGKYSPFLSLLVLLTTTHMSLIGVESHSFSPQIFFKSRNQLEEKKSKKQHLLARVFLTTKQQKKNL